MATREVSESRKRGVRWEIFKRNGLRVAAVAAVWRLLLVQGLAGSVPSSWTGCATRSKTVPPG